jgi:hypothetical protein
VLDGSKITEKWLGFKFLGKRLDDYSAARGKGGVDFCLSCFQPTKNIVVHRLLLLHYGTAEVAVLELVKQRARYGSEWQNRQRMKHARQCVYNVTLRRFRLTVGTVEKQ